MVAWDAISTKRPRIVQFGEEHLTERYVGWLNDADVVRYGEQRHVRHSLESCQAYFESMQKSDDFFCAIEEIEQSLGHIGNISITVDLANRLADVAILIGEKKSWGKGYGLEAWVGVLDTLLGRDRMRKVSAGTVASNLAMIEIMRRSGMVADGRRKNHLVIEGATEDTLHLAAFSGQWNTRIRSSSTVA